MRSKRELCQTFLYAAITYGHLQYSGATTSRGSAALIFCMVRVDETVRALRGARRTDKMGGARHSFTAARSFASVSRWSLDSDFNASGLGCSRRRTLR